MGKMHEKLMKKQAMKKIIDEHAKSLREKLLKKFALFSKYGIELETREAGTNHIALTAAYFDTIESIDNSISDSQYDELNKIQKTDFANNNTSFLDKTEFRIIKDKINFIIIPDEEIFNYIETLERVNIRPFEEKNEFSQLFKQSTKTKELCL